MNHPLKTFVFRDLPAPLSTLAGAGLVIMSSSRLSFGLTAAAALLWVYDLTMTVVYFAQPIYPKIGKNIALILLTSFLGSCFLLLLWLYSPLLALETGYIILLTSCYCVGSPAFARFDQPAGKPDTAEFKKIILKTSLEAGSLGILIIGFALIREPLGFTTLSLPGGPQGIIELFPPFDEDSFLPIGVISGSSGALLLLGYGAALFRNIKK
jgi:hypothetical protein